MTTGARYLVATVILAMAWLGLASSTAHADPMESEPNDTQSQATQLTVGLDWVSGALSSLHDIDWFCFTAKAAGQGVTIQVAGPQSHSITVSYAGDPVQWAEPSRTMRSHDLRVWHEGQFCFQIYGPASDYQLRVLDGSLPKDPDGEPNVSRSTAVEMNLGQAVSGTQGLGDRDFYHFTVTEAGRYRVVMQGTALVRSNVQVISATADDRSGGVMNLPSASQTVSGDGQYSQVVELPKGSYYLMTMQSYQGVGGRYQLTVTPTTDPVPQDTEPNDLSSQVQPLPVNQPTHGWLSAVPTGAVDPGRDVDHFQATLLPNRYYKLEVVISAGAVVTKVQIPVAVRVGSGSTERSAVLGSSREPLAFTTLGVSGGPVPVRVTLESPLLGWTHGYTLVLRDLGSATTLSPRFGTVVEPTGLAPDLLSVDGAGQLWASVGAFGGAQPLRRPIVGGLGFGTYTWLAKVPTRLGAAGLKGTTQVGTSSGTAGVLGRTKDGRLIYHPFVGLFTVGPGYQVGSGWSSMGLLTVTADMNNDGDPEILGRNGAGELTRYRIKGTASAQGVSVTREGVIGRGWNSIRMLTSTGSVDGNTSIDLLAVDQTGRLLAYTTTSAGTFQPGNKQVGSGWQMFTSLAAPGAYDGAGLLVGVGAPALRYYLPKDGRVTSLGSDTWLSPVTRLA